MCAPMNPLVIGPKAEHIAACIIEDPATKRNLPPGYTAVLEERVAYLERLLKDVCPEMQVALDHMTPVSSASFPGLPSS